MSLYSLPIIHCESNIEYIQVLKKYDDKYLHYFLKILSWIMTWLTGDVEKIMICQKSNIFLSSIATNLKLGNPD